MSIQPYEPPADSGALVRYETHNRGVSSLREWAEAARLAHQVAQSLVKTSFVPREYRGKPDEATAAILAGDEVGLSPIASLNAYSIIQGRAAPNALTLRAICQSRGHQFELVESTPSRCVMRCRRAGATEWDTVTWTIQRAAQLKLTSRDQWKNQPQAMLVARATSEAARLVGADAILGIPYSAEELVDTTAGDEPVATTTRTRRRTPASSPALPPAGAAPLTVQAGPPPLPGEHGYETADETADDPVEEAGEPQPADAEPEDEVGDDEPAAEEAVGAGPPEQKRMRRLFALLRDTEVGDRHEHATRVLGRPVGSYQSLTAGDVEHLIENLEALSHDN